MSQVLIGVSAYLHIGHFFTLYPITTGYRPLLSCQ